MLVVRKDAIHVIFLWNVMAYFVLVVNHNYESHHVLENTERN